MTARDITYDQLKTAIEISFRDDKKIFDFYDPNIKVSSVEDIVKNISEKVATHQGLNIKGIYHKNELIGYIVYNKVALISFSLSVKFRIRKFLREFYSIIKKELGGKFVCYLFTRNQRAIKWLSKMGMVINYSDYNITQLQCH